jgi:hypothetical protein
VGEESPPGDVPGRVHTRRAGPQQRVGADEPPGVKLNLPGLGVEALGHRATPRGHEQLLDLDERPIGQLEAHPGPGLARSGNLRVEVYLGPSSAERLGYHVARLWLLARQEPALGLDEAHVGAEAGARPGLVP